MISILLVDDETELLEIARLYLEDQRGFRVQSASSAKEALHLIQETLFDVVVSDYQMPVMDGIQFLKKLRGKKDPIPFIIFTGRGREEIVIEALNEGADFYLQKGGEPEAQFAELSHVIRNVVRQHRAEDELAESEEKYRHLIEHSNEAIVVAQDGLLKLVNQRVVEQTGYSEQELLSMPFSAFIHPDDRAMVVERYQKRMKGEELPSRYSFRLGTKDGSTRWVEISATVIDWDGRPATLNFLTDITERKKVEEALCESEEVFREVFNEANDAIFLHEMLPGGLPGLYFRVNNIACKRLGYSREELCKMSPRDIVPPQNRIAIPDIAATLRLRRYTTFEIIHQRKDGSTFPVEVSTHIFTLQERPVALSIARDITERKRTEEALKESEEKYHTVFENTGTAMIVVEENTIISLVNAEFAKLSGYSKDDIEGKKKWTEFVVKEDLERMLAQHKLRRQNKEKALTHYDFRFVTKSGDIRNIYLSIDVIPGTKKSVASLMDVTERKMTEAALRVSENRYRSVVEDQTEFICRFIPAGTLTFVNDAYCRYFGLKREECVGKRHSLVIPPDDLSLMKKHITSLTLENPVATIRHRIIMPSGEVKWQRWSDRALFDKDGHVVEYQSVGWDITDVVKAEEALRNSEIQYRSLTENSPDLIARFDRQCRHLYVNAIAAKAGRYSPEEYVGKTIPEVHVPEQDARKWEERIRTVFETGKVLDVEDTFETPDGQRYFHTKFVPEIGTGGSILSVQSIARDITGRKRAEEAIRSALAEKEVLLREVHHRVKNNLAGIIALINLQTSSLTDPASIFQFKGLETRIRSMALVHESLCLTKDLARIDVATYTDNLTRHLLAVYGDDPKIQFRIDMGDIMVSIDTAMPCGLVMTEIVTNSLKFAFPPTFSCGEIRGEPCTISITMQREGSDYLLTIADNGIGMPEGIDVTMSHSLGLFLIRFIVEHQLQGSLAFSITRGTMYTIRFPEPESKE